MRRISTLLLIAVIVYLSSCSNDNKNTNLLITPSVDSVSQGSLIDFSFKDKHFYINDLSLNNSPVITTTVKFARLATDSSWTAAIIETDHRSTRMSLNLMVARDTDNVEGIYFVTTTSSTFTDFSSGENKTYAIAPGSSVTITHSDASYVTGTFALNMHYNHDTALAYGSFKIFH